MRLLLYQKLLVLLVALVLLISFYLWLYFSFFRHGLDKKIIITYGIPSILLSFLGASLVGVIPQSILQIILGVFLIVFSVLFLFKPLLKFAANTRTTAGGGSISGFITGVVGTGGALRAMFLTGFNLEKTKYIATAAVIALATDSTRIPSYIYQGFLLLMATEALEPGL